MASKCLARSRFATIAARQTHRRDLFIQLRFSSASSQLTTSTCPPSTCACAATPDLEIDRTKPLINTVPRHSKHLIVHTGRDDWASRIEDDEGKPNIAKELKALLGPKGEFYEVCVFCIKVLFVFGAC